MKKFIKYSLLLGLLGFFIYKIDFKQVYENLILFKPLSIVIICILQSLTMVFLAFQWKEIVGLETSSVSYRDVFMMNSKGNIFDFITPGVKVGGEYVRLKEMKSRFGFSNKESLNIIGLQKTVSIFSFLLLTIVTIFYFFIENGFGEMWIVYGFILFLAFNLSLFLFFIYPRPILTFIKKHIYRKMDMENILDFFSKYKGSLSVLLNNKKVFLKNLSLGVMIWALFPVKLYILIVGLDIDINFISAMYITYITYLMGMLPISIGGFGGFDGTMVFLLKLNGIGVGMGLCISLVFRFSTMIYEFIFSLLAILVEKVYLKFKEVFYYAKSEEERV